MAAESEETADGKVRPQIESAKLSSNRKTESNLPERREQPRHSVRFAVSVRIIVEKETLSPQKLEGVCRNIGADGATVWVPKVSRKKYGKMIQRKRIMRLEWTLPETAQKISLLGKLAWFGYEGTPSVEACELGIAFDQQDMMTTGALVHASVNPYTFYGRTFRNAECGMRIAE